MAFDTGPFAILLAFVTGPFAILLAVRFSFRLVCFLGGVSLCVGYVCSAFTQDVVYWYLTYSIIAGNSSIGDHS